MEEKRLMSRREFLRLTTLVGTGAAIAACAPATAAPTNAVSPTKPPAPAATQPPAPAATQPPISKFKQAPMLDALVKDGKLPPVEKRLPENPWVAPTLDSVGKLGGMIRRGYNGISDRTGCNKFVDRTLVWFDKNLVLKPRIAESWTVTPDGKEWTIKLRKGTKWSDGKDFTSDNIKWYYDNVVLNKTLSPSLSGNRIWYDTKKSPAAALEIIDPVTFKMKFTEPKPFVLTAMVRSFTGVYAPGHYLKEFHGELTSDKAKLDAEVKKRGVADWAALWDIMVQFSQNPNLPTLTAWVVKPGDELGKEVFDMVRNPYFWAVDSAGNQLPYLDQVRFRLFKDANVFKLWVTNGEIDFQGRHVPGTAADYTLLKQSETKSDYKVFKGSSGSHIGFQPNQATKNLPLREFFQNRKVRIGLSLAIDRDRINELVYGGLAVPRQYSPLKSSPNYSEKAANAYIKFDLAAANKMLDEAGYKDKDADGFRKYKDGTTISFTIEGIEAVGSPAEDTAQQVVKMWAKAGVKCAYKYIERSLYSQHYAANEIEMSGWGGDRSVLPLASDAVIFRGVQDDRPWALGFGLWYKNNASPNGVKPPDGHFIYKIWEIWDKIAVEPDTAKQNALFNQILDIWAEEVPSITVVGELPSFAVVKTGFKNFPDNFTFDDTTGDEHLYNTETYYWDDPSKHPVT